MQVIQGVFAQTTQSIIVAEPDLRDFPTVRSAFKVYNELGRPVQSITAKDVLVYENTSPIPINDFQEKYNGVHFTLAVNSDRTLDVRDTAGISYYEYLRTSIEQWQKSASVTDQDEWSLTFNDDVHYLHLKDLNNWLLALMTYPSDMRRYMGNLESLITAVDSAYESNVALDQVLLYITPEPLLEDITTLSSLKQRALEKHLTINVWMVGKSYVLDTERGQTLLQLAKDTGGDFFIYSGSEAIPDIQTYLDGYGSSYTCTYTSQIRGSGMQTQTLSGRLENQEIFSPELSFYLQVLAPKPVFISPPLEINRVILPHDNDQTPIIQPEMQQIEVLIEFPDGKPRALAYAQLYADGVLVDENSMAPFEKFNWEMGSISESGMVNLQVNIEDSLGLQASSATLPIQINVESAQIPENDTDFWKYGWLLIAVPIILTMSAVSLILKFRRNRLDSLIRQQQAKSQPQKHSPSSSRGRQASSIFLDTTARLIKLDQDLKPVGEKPILLINTPIIFGRDPAVADVALQDASIEAVHAKLQRLPDGNYLLTDLGSTAGTWVNYAPISQQGIIIEHGDIIHIGSLTFRFMNSDTSLWQKPKTEG